MAPEHRIPAFLFCFRRRQWPGLSQPGVNVQRPPSGDLTWALNDRSDQEMQSERESL